MPKNDPITIPSAELRDRLDARMRSGGYASHEDVIRAALRALDREDSVLDAILLEKVREALDDPEPSIPADDVFAELQTEYERDVRALPVAS